MPGSESAPKMNSNIPFDVPSPLSLKKYPPKNAQMINSPIISKTWQYLIPEAAYFVAIFVGSIADSSLLLFRVLTCTYARKASSAQIICDFIDTYSTRVNALQRAAYEKCPL